MLLRLGIVGADAIRLLHHRRLADGRISLPQVAATLAAALVAFETRNAEGVRLIDEPVINTVIVLMVVTSVLGPVLTERFGQRLARKRPDPRRSRPTDVAGAPPRRGAPGGRAVETYARRHLVFLRADGDYSPTCPFEVFGFPPRAALRRRDRGAAAKRDRLFSKVGLAGMAPGRVAAERFRRAGSICYITLTIFMSDNNPSGDTV